MVCEIKIVIFYFTLLHIIHKGWGRIVPIERWSANFEDVDLEDIYEGCSGRTCFAYPEKRTDVSEEILQVPRLMSRTTIAHASWQACSCESHYEIRDLGDGHYPRYLPVSLCKQKSCQNKFHQCRLLYYRVFVLKRRQLDELGEESIEGQRIEELQLPESLNHKWKLLPISIPVACVTF